MPDLFEIEINIDEAKQRALGSLVRQLPRAMLATLRLTVADGINEMWTWIRTEKWFGGPANYEWRKEAYSDRLAVRSGRLIKSLRKTVKMHKSQGEVEGRLFVSPKSKAAEYAHVHEFGAVIRPVQARLLTIPLTREARMKGSPRRWAKGTLFPVKPWSSPGRSGGMSSGWFLARKPGGSKGFRKSLGGQRLKTAPGQGLIFEYMGVEKVVIPARPAFGPAADKFFPTIVQRAESNIAELLDRMAAGGGRA